MKIVGPPVCGCRLVESPPMSQRSHIASSGSTAICVCSAACSAPSSWSSGRSAETIASGSSYHSAWVENDVCGRSSPTRSSTSWSRQAARLVGDDLLGHDHRAEREPDAEPLAAVVEPLDVHVGLALGLRVPVALERLHERAPQLEVELRDLERAPAVQVDRALVRRVERAPRVDRAEQLARADVDDREAVARRSSAARPRSPGTRRRGAGRTCRPGAGAARPPPRAARRSAPARRRTTPRRPARAGPRARRRARARRGSARSRDRGSPPRRAGRGTRPGWRQKNWSSASSPAT